MNAWFRNNCTKEKKTKNEMSIQAKTLFCGTIQYTTLRNEHLADEVEGIHEMLLKWNQRGDR